MGWQALPAMRVDATFFKLPTLELARSLLGKKLTTQVRSTVTSGVIVEVEAYCGSGDLACHASRGCTPRNEVMFRRPGHCYVYFIYGMHYCVNVVSDPEGIGSAVLLRAVEPLEGITTMQRRRGKSTALTNLARGPGRLCQAFGINRGFSGEHFADSKRIWIEPYLTIDAAQIQCSPRIGISQAVDLEWRFFIKDSPYVSACRSTIG